MAWGEPRLGRADGRFKLTDNLQHKTWKYLDPRWSDRNPIRRDLVKQCFAEADKAVGSLLDYASTNNAAVLIVSDHGHGSLEGKVQANLLLERWGYLALREGGSQRATRRSMYGTASRSHASLSRGGATCFMIWPSISARTRACVMHAGMAGFLYVNLQGRQPSGIVTPSQYESLRDELRARLLGDECRVRDPQGRGIRLFSEVHKPEELYGCSRADQPWLPDLILTPHESLAVVRKIRGRRVVRWLSYDRLEGTHRPDGILVATGPGIAKAANVRATSSIAPTILAMLGLRVPDDMQGRVIQELFERQPTIAVRSGTGGSSRSEEKEEVYSAPRTATGHGASFRSGVLGVDAPGLGFVDAGRGRLLRCQYTSASLSQKPISVTASVSTSLPSTNTAGVPLMSQSLA